MEKIGIMVAIIMASGVFLSGGTFVVAATDPVISESIIPEKRLDVIAQELMVTGTNKTTQDQLRVIKEKAKKSLEKLNKDAAQKTKSIASVVPTE